MTDVDRVGTFRFNRVSEVGLTENRNDKKELQSVMFVARFHFNEFWDEEDRQWVDWSEYDMNTVGFLCVFYRDKKTGELTSSMTLDQVKKVFGWDGNSLEDLVDGDYSELKGQIRVTENDYEKAKSPFKVAWLDDYDAEPGGKLRTLDKEGVKGLQKDLALLLQSTGTAPKAASAKKKPSPPKKPTPPPTAKEEPEETEEERKARLREKSERLRKAKDGVKPAPPAKKPESSTQERPNQWTKQMAWETIVEMKNDEITDNQLSEVWHDKIDEFGDEDKLTSDQWSQIKDAVLDYEYEEGKTVAKF